jgi:hypothetical protein
VFYNLLLIEKGQKGQGKVDSAKQIHEWQLLSEVWIHENNSDRGEKEKPHKAVNGIDALDNTNNMGKAHRSVEVVDKHGSP